MSLNQRQLQQQGPEHVENAPARRREPGAARGLLAPSAVAEPVFYLDDGM